MADIERTDLVETTTVSDYITERDLNRPIQVTDVFVGALSPLIPNVSHETITVSDKVSDRRLRRNIVVTDAIVDRVLTTVLTNPTWSGGEDTTVSEFSDRRFPTVTQERNEASTVTDVISTRRLDTFTSLSETITVSEDVVRAISLVRELSDATTLSEDLVRDLVSLGGNLTKTLTEDITVSDYVTDRRLRRDIVVTDIITDKQLATISTDRTWTGNETSGVTDVITARILSPLLALPFETSTVTDIISDKSLGSTGNLTKTPFETISIVSYVADRKLRRDILITDIITNTSLAYVTSGPLTKDLFEHILIGEYVVIDSIEPINVTDVISDRQLTTVSGISTITLNEPTITITENLIRSLSLALSGANEATTVTDVVTRAMALIKDPAVETTTITENLVRALALVSDNKFETTTITDVLTRALSLARGDLVETISITDIPLMNLRKQLNEATTVSENLVTALRYEAAISERYIRLPSSEKDVLEGFTEDGLSTVNDELSADSPKNSSVSTFPPNDIGGSVTTQLTPSSPVSTLTTVLGDE